jgi:hypothetical protein
MYMSQVVELPGALVVRIRAATGAIEKMEIAGLIRKPYDGGATKEECGNCIYYLSNHRFCDMPEIQFPVESDWWCRLWRV